VGPCPELPPVFETVYAFMFLEPLEYSVMFKLEKLILNYMTASNAYFLYQDIWYLTQIIDSLLFRSKEINLFFP
jgi:hypothetical protein